MRNKLIKTEEYLQERKAAVDEQLKNVEKEIYNGDMPAHNKAVARRAFEQEHDFWTKEQADYRYGQDEGLEQIPLFTEQEIQEEQHDVDYPTKE